MNTQIRKSGGIMVIELINFLRLLSAAQFQNYLSCVVVEN